MVHLNIITNMFLQKKIDIAEFQGKNILLIGGYSLKMLLDKNQGEMLFVDFLKLQLMNGGVKSCKIAATALQKSYEGINCDYTLSTEDLSPPQKVLSELEEQFDVIFVLSGMEKVSDPLKAFKNVRYFCADGGKIFMLLRTQAELGTKNFLNFYEDNWRYEPEDIVKIFSCDENFVIEMLLNKEAFVISFTKTDKKFQPDKDTPLFNCRVRKKVPYSESLKFDFFREYQDLDKIAQNEFTDKVAHGYIKKYDFFLNKFRTQEFNLLELGIFNGGSLKMWKRYFPYAEIYGVDINPKCKKYEDKRIHPIIMDLSSIENLKTLRDIKPTIIVDDASHLWSHQIKALITLFDVLPSGGVFIVEDMETSVNPDLFPGYNDFPISGYDFCERIIRVVMSKRPDAVADDFSAAITEIGMTTELIATIKGSCIFIKR